MQGMIFLIGFMGVGKTTIGKRLANQLAFDFIDTDRLIEEKFACTVSAYFEKFGEASFRKEEKIIILEITKKYDNVVVSVGGGLPCFNDNMELMNQTGTTVYLHRPPKELFHRLLQGRHKRPLIADMSEEELISFIEKKVSERESYYSQAHIVADRENQKPSKIIQLIEKNH